MEYIIVCALGVLLLLILKGLFRARSQRHRRKVGSSKRVLERVAQIPEPGAKLAYLRRIDPYVFEELLLTSFRRLGLRVRRNRRYSGDGGVDGMIFQDGRWVLIQAKRYSGHVSAEHFSEFSRLCQSRRMPGLFIHTGRTGEAIRSNESNLVQVISGDRLLNILTAAGR